MEKQKFYKEYLAPEAFCIMMQLDQSVLSGSFSNEDIGDETAISLLCLHIIAGGRYSHIHTPASGELHLLNSTKKRFV